MVEETSWVAVATCSMARETRLIPSSMALRDWVVRSAEAVWVETSWWRDSVIPTVRVTSSSTPSDALAISRVMRASPWKADRRLSVSVPISSSDQMQGILVRSPAARRWLDSTALLSVWAESRLR